MNKNGVVDSGETDPCSIDTDGDGIQDGTEIGITGSVPDPDGDGPLLGTDTSIFQPDLDSTTTTDPIDDDTDDVGSENVSSIQRYSTEKGAFETAGFASDGQVAGIDFTIIPAEGYFIFMKQEVLDFK